MTPDRADSLSTPGMYPLGCKSEIYDMFGGFRSQGRRFLYVQPRNSI